MNAIGHIAGNSKLAGKVAAEKAQYLFSHPIQILFSNTSMGDRICLSVYRSEVGANDKFLAKGNSVTLVNERSIWSNVRICNLPYIPNFSALCGFGA